MSYKFLKSVKFIKSMFPAGTFFRITEATDGKYVYNCQKLFSAYTEL